VRTVAQKGLARLYHYPGARLDYLRGALVHSRVHFSNSGHFNDPWDCQPYFDLSIGDPETRKRWGERLGPFYKDLPGELRAALAERIEGNWYDHPQFLRQIIQKLTASVRHFNIGRWRIYCLTSRPDSVLMWSHYAEQHWGICLGFDAAQEPIRRAFEVLYKESLPALGPDILTDAKAMVDGVLLNKAVAWKYEEEYRILARDGSVDPAFFGNNGRRFSHPARGNPDGRDCRLQCGYRADSLAAERGCAWAAVETGNTQARQIRTGECH
jgi:hypothetical protein